MKQSVLYTVIILLVGINLFLVFRLKKDGNLFSASSDTRPNASGSASSDQAAYISLLRGRILMQAKYNYISIDSAATAMDTLGNTKNLRTLVTGDENLVFFFTK